jgi:hypothetical protein
VFLDLKKQALIAKENKANMNGTAQSTAVSSRILDICTHFYVFSPLLLLNYWILSMTGTTPNYPTKISKKLK